MNKWMGEKTCPARVLQTPNRMKENGVAMKGFSNPPNTASDICQTKKKKEIFQSSVYVFVARLPPGCRWSKGREGDVRGRGQSQGDFFIRNCGATVALDDSRGTDIGVKSEWPESNERKEPRSAVHFNYCTTPRSPLSGRLSVPAAATATDCRA